MTVFGQSSGESPRFVDAKALFSYANMVFVPRLQSIEGDLLLGVVTSSGSFPVVIQPEGFIPLVRLMWAGDQPFDLYYKWSTGAEPGSYYWQVNAGQNIVGVSAYRGVNPAGPFNSYGCLSQGAKRKIIAPSIMTNKENCTLVAFFTGGGNGSELFTGPAGMTTQYEVNDKYNLCLKSADSIRQPVGFTEAMVAVMATSDFGGGIVVALTPK